MSRYRKLIAAIVGGLAEVVTVGLVHGTAAEVVTVIVTVATAFGVYQVPNAP